MKPQATQIVTNQSEEVSTKAVLYRPRFCLTLIYRAVNTRWSFAIRYYKDNRQIEEEYSADTKVEIENRRVSVVGRLRNKGMIICDCGCEFMEGNPYE